MKNKNKTKSELIADVERLQDQAMADLMRLNSIHSEFRWLDRAVTKYKIALERIAEMNNGSVACDIAQRALDESE